MSGRIRVGLSVSSVAEGVPVALEVDTSIASLLSPDKRVFPFDACFSGQLLDHLYSKFVSLPVSKAALGESSTLIVYGQSGTRKVETLFAPNSQTQPLVSKMVQDLVAKLKPDCSIEFSLFYLLENGISDVLTGESKEVSASGEDSEHILKHVSWTPLEKSARIAAERVTRACRSIIVSDHNPNHLILQLRISSGAGLVSLMSVLSLADSDAPGSTAISSSGPSNAPLRVLRACVRTLAAGRMPSFESSLLTLILKETFIGPTHAFLLLTARPDLDSGAETLLTLEFGAIAKSITKPAGPSAGATSRSQPTQLTSAVSPPKISNPNPALSPQNQIGEVGGGAMAMEIEREKLLQDVKDLRFEKARLQAETAGERMRLSELDQLIDERRRIKTEQEEEVSVSRNRLSESLRSIRSESERGVISSGVNFEDVTSRITNMVELVAGAESDPNPREALALQTEACTAISELAFELLMKLQTIQIQLNTESSRTHWLETRLQQQSKEHEEERLKLLAMKNSEGSDGNTPVAEIPAVPSPSPASGVTFNVSDDPSKTDLLAQIGLLKGKRDGLQAALKNARDVIENMKSDTRQRFLAMEEQLAAERTAHKECRKALESVLEPETGEGGERKKIDGEAVAAADLKFLVLQTELESEKAQRRALEKVLRQDFVDPSQQRVRSPEESRLKISPLRSPPLEQKSGGGKTSPSPRKSGGEAAQVVSPRSLSTFISQGPPRTPPRNWSNSAFSPTTVPQRNQSPFGGASAAQRPGSPASRPPPGGHPFAHVFHSPQFFSPHPSPLAARTQSPTPHSIPRPVAASPRPATAPIATTIEAAGPPTPSDAPPITAVVLTPTTPSRTPPPNSNLIEYLAGSPFGRPQSPMSPARVRNIPHTQPSPRQTPPGQMSTTVRQIQGQISGGSPAPNLRGSPYNSPLRAAYQPFGPIWY